jgi:hypothetical protein
MGSNVNRLNETRKIYEITWENLVDSWVFEAWDDDGKMVLYNNVVFSLATSKEADLLVWILLFSLHLSLK